MLATLDLFAGIGGFTLGLEKAGGFETKVFCEIDEFAQKVLKKNWPNVMLLQDVREIEVNTIDHQIDVITGGFPCQDLSIAGLKGGLDNNERSGLWRECIRLVGLFRPKYAVFENVSNLLAGPNYAPGGWFSTILRDLAECGYDAEWQNIPACAVGGQHNRERVWIIAYPNKDGSERRRNISSFIGETTPRLPQSILQISQEDHYGIRGDLWGTNAARVFRVGDGVPTDPYRNKRIAALGNAIIPQIATIIGRAIIKHMKQDHADQP